MPVFDVVDVYGWLAHHAHFGYFRRRLSAMLQPEIIGKVACGECSAPMRLRDSRYGKFWGCTRFPVCRGTHGAHPDGRPLGTPADSDTKRLRMMVHEIFDVAWQSGSLSRNKAYKRLAKAMGITREQCHIGTFDAPTCRRAIEIIQNGFQSGGIHA